MRKKILVTGGCSFSLGENTWAEFAAQCFDHSYHTAMGSMGNRLIARRIIYEVQSVIKQGADPKDILVLVQWTSPDRSEIYWREDQCSRATDQYRQLDNETVNPLRWPRDSGQGAWIIQNPNWQQPSSLVWYQHFWNAVEQRVKTAETWIMLEQWLAGQGVEWLWAGYTSEVYDPGLRLHPQLDYLYDQCLFDRWWWSPERGGQWEWLVEQGLALESQGFGSHPTRSQHEQWFLRQILPRVEQQGWI